MDDFDPRFQDATAAIGTEYFLLPVVARDPVYRERVYCYELYHQLRLRWPTDQGFPWRLNGKVDKRSHVYFQTEPATAPKPDFLVHQPGRHRNYMVIEVKPGTVRMKGLRKDLATLRTFCEDFDYERGIQLIYGANPSEALARFHQALDGQAPGRIELWIHPHPGTVAYRIA